MRYGIGIAALAAAAILGSCAKKEQNTPTATTEAPQQAAQPAGGPRASVRLKDGSRVPGTVVASSQTDIVIAGDDGIERKIPLAQVQSVDYGEPAKAEPVRPPKETPQRTAKELHQVPAPAPAPATPPAAAPPPARVYELAAGSDISVRTNEAIDSATAAEGQTFDAQVTRDIKDAGGEVVVPRRSDARIVIRSASKGGRFRGASDLVLDLQSVSIGGRRYAVDTADVSQKGKSGVGANKRTAEYTGGGAALGAIIGAIAGGGKGAAIGAGAGAGAGALTQIITKGGSIKVPAESVLTFRLDKPLRVSAVE